MNEFSRKFVSHVTLSFQFRALPFINLSAGFSQAQLARTFYPAILKSKLLVSKFSFLKLTNCSVFCEKKTVFTFKRSIVVQFNMRLLTIEATPSSIWSSSSLQWLVKYHYMYSCNCPVIKQYWIYVKIRAHCQVLEVMNFFLNVTVWIVYHNLRAFYVSSTIPFESTIPNFFHSYWQRTPLPSLSPPLN